ncbi:glycoside hydrolase family 97 protein [Sphingobium sp. BYY-5]|uniref:glycoside hydrolase family 97 protein n=1 Tax=Sphingobium sp. BYY-5 TaxID=2926400 RepID=UPI001FA71C18|nr:glycoside hydrolase family 97 protein [Sphingobium sp. BYY-5]MCI4588747.1 glycoside hydrolase family 97 protein [Sphingobium sp. BYY-5]
MTSHPTRRTILGGMSVSAIGGIGLPLNAQSAPDRTALSISSPNGRLTAQLLLPGRSADYPLWSASLDGKPALEPSKLALVLANGRLLGPQARYLGHTASAIDDSWTPPYGIATRYDGRAHQIEAQFEDRRSRIRFAIRLLAHDDGVAIRFVLLAAPGNKVELGGEAMEFRFPTGTNIWSSRDEGDYARSAPGRIAPVPHPELTNSTDKGALADTPLLATTPDGLSLSISESDRLHYPRLMFAPGDTDQSVTTRLMHFPGRATGYSGPGETHAAPLFSVDTPFTTPWRLILVSDTPAALLEKAGLVTTLATPNRLGDTGWIRPGRAFRIRKPYSNAGAMDGIAFAEKRKLDYIEFDAHWYGDGTDPSDATRPIDGLDMQAIVAEARKRNIGTILYVDRVPAMRQLADIVSTYRRWGVAGIKFGFIWEGRQEDTDFIYDLVKSCGEHHLLVNLHDNLRPAGLERTLPNYVALEGVRGNEQFPTARHNVTLPFTRALSGPIDYTICYDHYLNKTTNAHQLAMAAVYYNPLTFLYWYDTPAKYATGAWPALRWFDECPTSWDETRAIDGQPGQFVAVARRHGERWFLGAMTNEDARRIDVPLSFLGEGDWRATIFADGAPGQQPRSTPVVISTRKVAQGDTLPIAMQPSGGQAILFERTT